MLIALSLQSDNSGGKGGRHDAHTVCRVFCHAGPTGQRHLGDGFPPTVSRKLSKNSALSPANGWSTPAPLPALHRDNGTHQAETAALAAPPVLSESSYCCALQFLGGKAFHQQLREKQSMFVGVCFTDGFRRLALYVHRFSRTVRKRAKTCYRNETVVCYWLP